LDVPFIKMHGLGNDYVYLDLLARPELAELDMAAFSISCSDRHRGIGSDGVILIAPGDAETDVRMVMFNADGSEGEMCGNGVRCVMRYAVARGYAPQTLKVRARAGIIAGEVLPQGHVRVDMGVPRLDRQTLGFTGAGEMREWACDVSGETLSLTGVSMGNPHVVSFCADRGALEARALRLGPILEHAPWAPARTNVEFVSVLAPGELAMEVWERGSGRTEACGTGACASLVAAALTGRSGRSARVHLAGGALDITWREDGYVDMTGPTALSFRGTYEWPRQEDGAAW